MSKVFIKEVNCYYCGYSVPMFRDYNNPEIHYLSMWGEGACAKCGKVTVLIQFTPQMKVLAGEYADDSSATT